MSTKNQYSCFYCGDSFKAGVWKADQRKIQDECGSKKIYEEKTTEIYNDHMPHLGGTGICNDCFKEI